MRDTRPTIYNISARVSFSDCLADGLLARYGPSDDDPLRLANVTLLLPTRRAVRSVREALLRRANGRPMLLPNMRALGDLGGDEEMLEADAALLGSGEDIDLAPAISPLKRQFLLSQLILKWAEARGDDGMPLAPAQAMSLAKDLMVFMDQAMAEEVDLKDLPTLAPDRFAAHWQETVQFLDIITHQWPSILKEMGLMDGVARRIEVLHLLQFHWENAPPSHPVIAAGSTGSVPSTANLLGAIARLPQGAVILPGLDMKMDEEIFQGLEASHPQFGMKELLLRMQAVRDEVEAWTDLLGDPAAQAREVLINQALCPPDASDQWQAFKDRPEMLRHGHDGIRLIEMADAREEAATIAMIMRHGLETPEQTIALISPDQFLARRVEAALKRWNIQVDSSAGRPLEKTVPATLLRAIADVVRADFSPVPLLALLKHPLCCAGHARSEHLRLARLLERKALRGVRTVGGLPAILRKVRQLAHEEETLNPVCLWLERIQDMMAPLLLEVQQDDIDASALFRALVISAEALASTDESEGASLIWVGEAGEVLSRLISDVMGVGADCPPLTTETWPDMLDSLMTGKAVRPQFGTHPRLFIWGPLEARLQRADIVILGGLNEGIWPQIPDTGPWLSRPMNETLGLLPPERRLGLAAHDFFQGACASQVFLTRAQKVDGEPRNASRWLLRLQALLKTIGEGLTLDVDHINWARTIDRPDTIVPAKPPSPRPPLEARPRNLSVTRIGEWTRDPYGIYARKILGLTKLDDLDADPGAMHRGNLVHLILENYMQDHEELLRNGDRDKALNTLLEEGRKAFTEFEDSPTVQAFWWARFERVAKWFVDHERARPDRHLVAGLEVEAKHEFDAPGGPFTLTGKADRLDRVGHEISIYDYKTGQGATYKEVLAGFQPQLSLEAYMARQGKFPDIPASDVKDIAYIKVSGGREPGDEKPVRPTRNDKLKLNANELADHAFEGLQKYVATFDDEATPYRSRVRPQFDATPYDYDHLARVKEWQEEGGGDE